MYNDTFWAEVFHDISWAVVFIVWNAVVLGISKKFAVEVYEPGSVVKHLGKIS